MTPILSSAAAAPAWPLPAAVDGLPHCQARALHCKHFTTYPDDLIHDSAVLASTEECPTPWARFVPPGRLTALIACAVTVCETIICWCATQPIPLAPYWPQ